MYFDHNLRFTKIDKELKQIGLVWIITNTIAVFFEILTSWCSFFHDYLRIEVSSVSVNSTHKTEE